MNNEYELKESDNIPPTEYLKQNAAAILAKDSRTRTIFHQVGDNIIRIHLSIKPVTYYDDLEKAWAKDQGEGIPRPG